MSDVHMRGHHMITEISSQCHIAHTMTQQSISGHPETWSGHLEWWNYGFALLCRQHTFKQKCFCNIWEQCVNSEIDFVWGLETLFSPPRHVVSLGFGILIMYGVAHFSPKNETQNRHRRHPKTLNPRPSSIIRSSEP